MDEPTLDWLASRNSPKDEPVFNEDKTQHVEYLLERLTTLQRDVVLFRAGNGLSHREIGRYLWPELQEHMATKRSESAYSKALTKLRNMDWRPKPDALTELFKTRMGLEQEELRDILKGLIADKGKDSE